MPGDYSNSFDSCAGDDTEPMGVYGSSTFYQVGRLFTSNATWPDKRSTGRTLYP